MNFIPYRIKKRFTEYTTTRYLNKNNINFDSIPQFIGDWPRINNAGIIKIGLNCCFRSFRLCQNITVFKNAELRISNNSFLNDGVNICATQLISVGSDVMIGDMTYIYDTDFHQISPSEPIKQAPVKIGNNVWIGAKAMILAGTIIGDHSVVAAGSIVTGKIPSKSLVAGVPARVIKNLKMPDSWVRK